MEKKEELLSLFEKTCDSLAEEINQTLFDGSRDWYWVGEQVGGVCDYGDTDFLTPDEMYLVLSYKMSYDEYAKWRNWNLDYGNIIHRVNLWSWLHGFGAIAYSESKAYEKKIRDGQ